MLQTSGDPDLALESLGAERGGQVRAEHLEGDEAIVAEVPGEVDRRHAAAAELALEEIAVAQGVGEGGIDSSHDPAGWGTLPMWV